MIVDGLTNETYYIEISRLAKPLPRLNADLTDIYNTKQYLICLLEQMHALGHHRTKREFLIINQFKRLNRIEYALIEQKKIIFNKQKSVFALINKGNESIIQAAKDQVNPEAVPCSTPVLSAPVFKNTLSFLGQVQR